MVQVVFQKDSISYCFLNNFDLAEGLALDSIDMRVSSSKRIKYAQLIKKDVEFI
jgi:hypothetical protein